MSPTIPLARQVAAVRDEIDAMRSPLEIPLRGGQTLLIEARDLWVFSYYHWTLIHHKNSGARYLQRKERGRPVHFHREIIAAPVEFVVDHINGNGLDNRRSNLRLATRQQNNWNRARQSPNDAGYLGVSLHKSTGLYRARLRAGDAEDRCTYHRTAKEAAIARDTMAIEVHGEFACLNFGVPDRRIAEMDAVRMTLEALLEAERQRREPELF